MSTLEHHYQCKALAQSLATIGGTGCDLMALNGLGLARNLCLNLHSFFFFTSWKMESHDTLIVENGIPGTVGTRGQTVGVAA